jgi:hypothetical protein
VFWIHDVLIRIRILGSVHWIIDPDSALFFNGFQDGFSTFFWLITYFRYINISNKTVKNNVFLNYLLVDGRILKNDVYCLVSRS